MTNLQIGQQLCDVGGVHPYFFNFANELIHVDIHPQAYVPILDKLV